MSELNAPMTAAELISIRTKMKQTPASLAAYLSVNVNTYYNWERHGKVPSMAAGFIRILFQGPHPEPRLSATRRSSSLFKQEFSPGAMHGKLEVLSRAPHTGSTCHRNLNVKCACGLVLVMRASVVKSQRMCKLSCKGAPATKAERRKVRELKDEETAESVMVPLDMGDTPDLDASAAEWSAYHARKLHEKAALDTATTTATTSGSIDEWEDGL